LLKLLQCTIDSEITHEFFDMLERRWEGEVGLSEDRQTFTHLFLAVRGADDDLLHGLHGRQYKIGERLGHRIVSLSPY
jgi:hypothetical protein